MREIKFRVWDEYNKKWIYFSLESLFSDVLGKKKRPEIVELWHARNYELKIYRYTGLKDKNGKEIYEGDIIEIDNDWKSGEGERGEVKWDEKNAMFRLFCYTKYGGEGWFMPENKTWVKLKIIGNIYENPELLREEGK